MKTIVKRFKRAIAIIADTHYGSSYAIFQESFRKSRGNIIRANKYQLKLLEFWNYFWKKCDEWNVDLVLHAGDALEGLNKEEIGGERLLFSSLDEQIAGFVDLMKPYLKERQFGIVSGSSYHESTEFQVSRVIAEKLGGSFLGYIKNIKIENTDRVLNIAHSVGYPQVYLSTILDREMLFQKVAESIKKIPKVDILVRAHVHISLYIHQEGGHIIFAPCWKIFEGMRLTTKLYSRKVPSIGGVIIAFDTDDKIYVIPYEMKEAITPDLKPIWL